MWVYAVVKELITKDPWRSKRQDRASRGRKSPAQKYWGALSGVSPQAARSGEKRAPKTSIQDGKKGIRGLLIVFMEIRAVTGFSGEMDAERSASFPGALAE